MDKAVFTNITNNSYYLISSFLQGTDNKSYILDPLTCVIRLGVLSFKPVGTKISINQNKISYNDPNIFQGTVRWTYGDNRNDLHNLFKPLLYSTQWYDMEDPIISNIFTFAISGLEKLKLSYSSNSIICHSLDHYIDVIKKNKNIDNDSENVNELYKKLKKLWSNPQISIINSLLHEVCDTDMLNKKEYYINAIENILSIKEETVNDLIIKNTTLL